jgi:glycosyltransferase involved in cell wall biosynthesis
MKTPISAFIITKNEESRVQKAILSIKDIVDEIIVVDSGSTDRTLEIATSLGCRVVSNEWPGYVKQKIFAEKLCKHKWILNIDADEELSPELQKEISYIFEARLEEKYKGYRINFVILMPEDEKPRFLAPSNTFIRLYNKDYVSFANIDHESTTHDCAFLPNGMKEKGNIMVLSSPSYHRSSVSIWQLVNKVNFYTTEQAKDIVASNRRISRTRICLELFWWFLKSYFKRRYFVFGFQGFIYAMIFAFGKFLRLAKAHELASNKKTS